MLARRMIVAMFVAVLILTVGTAWGKRGGVRPGLLKSSVSDEKIVLEYNFSKPGVTKRGEYDFVQIEGLELYERVGAPIVPVRPVSVLLPFGKKAESVSVTVISSHDLPGTYYLMPGQKAYPVSYQGIVERTEPDAAIYGQSAAWPGKDFSEVGTQSKRGYQVFIVNIFPVQYRPLAGKVVFTKKMRVEIVLESSSREPVLRPTKRVKAKLKGDVENPSVLSSYESNVAKGGDGGRLIMEAGFPDSNSPLHDANCPYYGEDWEYVVITSPNFADSNNIPDANYSFQALCDSKDEFGISAGIVDTNWIYDNYDPNDYDPNNVDANDPNSNRAVSIRMFLMDAYETWGTEYALLGGGVDIIPARQFWHNGTIACGKDTIPVDMYYGCVEPNECTFNYDEDSKWGEPTDGVEGEEIDLWAEIYVGRAPVEDVNEIVNFIKKTLTYSSADSDYLWRVVMLGEAFVDPYGVWGKDHLEEIRIGGTYNGYYTEGFGKIEGFVDTNGCMPDDPCCCWPLYEKDAWEAGIPYIQWWSKDEMLDLMHGGVAIFNHFGHGRKVCMSYHKDFCNDCIESELENTDPFFAYSIACYPGSFDGNTPDGPDSNDCFAEVITTMEHGAYAVIMNARYGIGNVRDTDGPCQRFIRQFWDAVLGEGILAIGQAHQDSKEDNTWDIDDTAIRWTYYELNLFGDPEVWLKSCWTSKGRIELDKDYYNCDCNVGVTLYDSDLSEQGTWDVNIVTSGGDSETITLSEEDPCIGIFTGLISTGSGDVNSGDGILQVSHGETITVTYEDANDGRGNSASPNDTALVDCDYPVVSNIEVEPAVSWAIVNFDTNEPTTGRVLCDVNCGEPYSMEGNALNLATSHSILVGGLQPETEYFFIVEATDVANNTTVDSNNSQCYKFSTNPPLGDIYVPEDFDTIQDAIDNSWHGDTIWVAEGTYTGEGNRDLDMKGFAITVRSDDPNDPEVVAATVIDCNGSVNEPHCGFYFFRDEDANTIISGLTITNGYPHKDITEYEAGSAVFCRDGSSPTIRNCLIRNNGVNENEVDGTIACYRGANPQILNCIITDNEAKYAGGIEIWASVPTVANCIISNNTASNGGGIFCYQGGDATITNCTVTKNSASSGKGGIYSGGSSPSITNCIIWDNGDDLAGCSATYSCIEDGDSGTGNISDDPCFADADGNDFHVEPNSPCIDSGDPSGDYSGQRDMDAQPRLADGDANDTFIVDMGADEYMLIYNLDAELGYTTSVQDAVDDANDGERIVVVQGTYCEDINLNSVACVLMSTDPNDWDVVVGTVIDANGATQAAYMDANGVLSGFTVTGGTYGAYCDSADPEISKCIIEDNTTGGVYCAGSSAVITNNIIRGNSGYGINCWASGPIVKNNWICDNNSAGLRLHNAGVSAAVVRNNTIVYNNGKGIWRLGNASVVVSNCILWANDDDLFGCSATYSCVEDGDSGTGNISSNPLLASLVPTYDIVSYWELNDGDGNTAVDSIGDNNGTLCWGPNWTDGKIDGGLSFDGYDDYVDCGNDVSLDITDYITISAWIKIDSASTGEVIVHKATDTDWDDGYGLFYGIDYYENEGLWFWVDDWFDNQAYAAYSPDGKWHHIVGTYDGSEVRIYLDGLEGTSDTYTGSIGSTTSPLYIGGEPVGWRCIEGIIDEVIVYDRALSFDEAGQLYQYGLLGHNDYHLGPNSPCIDAGDPNGDYSGELDIDGQERIIGPKIDMGADEMVVVITDVNELQAMKDYLDLHYWLGNDIDASATSGWNGGAGFEPVGTEAYSFTGTFDGRGHTITDLYIDRPSTGHVGLFGLTMYAVIKDVNVADANVTGLGGTGILIGSGRYSKVDRCCSSGTLRGTASDQGPIGGLMGSSIWASTVVSKCHSSADVSAIGNYPTTNRSGGLVGLNSKGSIIIDCYATGDVSGKRKIGGLVGDNSWSSYGGYIKRCYSVGEVTATGGLGGGLVGYNYQGGVTYDSYWDVNTSGWDTSYGGTGKTTTEMMDVNTFEDWDFVNVWDINDGNSYPYLRE